MAKKKPHSQQRKKGQFSDTDDPAEAFDALSEEHTIADSLGTYESAFEDDDLDGAIDGTSKLNNNGVTNRSLSLSPLRVATI